MTKSKPFTISMITTWHDQCGIADYARALVGQLQNHAEIRVIELKKAGNTKASLNQIGLEANQSDIVHIQHEYAFFGGLMPWQNNAHHLLRVIKRPIMMTAHTWLQPFQSASRGRWLIRSVQSTMLDIVGWNHYLKIGQFQLAKHLVVHNQAFKAALVAQGMRESCVHYFPQAVAARPPKVQPNHIITRQGWQGKKILVHFGFIMPSKGHLLTLGMAPKLPADTIIVIAGASGRTASERSYARQVNNQVALWPGKCFLLGYLSTRELHELIAAADLCLFPYTAGTSSYALSLALAQHKACVTSSLPNFVDINETDEVVKIFNCNDQQDLQQQVLALLKNKQMRDKLEQAARQWVARHHWGMLAQAHLDLYQLVHDAAKRKGETKYVAKQILL